MRLWIIGVLVFLGAIDFLVISPLRVRRFTDDQAIACIVGEYAQNDIYGMKLIAHAIRNRGTLHGVYGLTARHNKKETGYIWRLASLAWFESAGEDDVTQGADSWYSVADYIKYGTPSDKQFLFKYRGTIFYKTIKPRRK